MKGQSIEEKQQGDKAEYNPYKTTVESVAEMCKKYSASTDLHDFYDNVKVKCKDALEYDKTWLEKQGEQKPTDKIEPKFKVKYAGSEYNVLEVKDSAGITFYGIEDEPNHIDYVKAENCEIISGYAIKENGSPYPTKTAVFSEQKPAWSEGDEYQINTILHGLDLKREIYRKKGNIVEEERYNTRYNWLKSLKDRYTWKPTEEQMKVLKIASESVPVGYSKTLNVLYNDLKKL